MRKIVLLIVIACLSLASFAQMQRGYVKTKGVLLPNGSVKPGQKMSDVVISIKGAGQDLLSKKDGSFSFYAPNETFFLAGITKKGYVLADPDATKTEYNRTKAPWVVVIEDLQERQKAINEARQQIRTTMTLRLQEKENEILALIDKNEQEKQQLLNQLQDQQVHTDQLLYKMAQRFVNTDYDHISETNRRINVLILDGKLDEADSLIQWKDGGLDQREKEIEEQRKTTETAEAYAKESRKDLTLKIKDLGEDFYRKFTIHSNKYQNDSAAHYLARRAKLDSTNVYWQIDAGSFRGVFLSDYSGRIAYGQKALSQAISQYGEKSEIVVDVYNELAAAYASIQDYGKALEYSQKAVAICDQLFDKSNTKLIETKILHGEIVGGAEGAQDAFGYFMQILTLDVPEKDLTEARLFKDFGDCYMAMNNVPNKINQCEYEYQNALEIYRNILGEDNLDVAYVYSRLGELYCESKDFDKALEYANKALAIYTSILTDNHTLVAAQNTSIGEIYRHKGDFNTAIEYYGKSIEIYNSALGEGNTESAITIKNMGVLFLDLENYQAAFDCFVKAFNMQIDKLGDMIHPSLTEGKGDKEHAMLIFEKCADGNESMQHYEDALLAHKEILRLKKETLGEAHLDLANTYLHIGDCILNGKTSCNNISIEEDDASYIKENSLNYNDAIAFFLVKHYPRALYYYQKALDIQKKFLKNNDLDMKKTYMRIVSAINGEAHQNYLDKNYKNALLYINKAISVSENGLGKKHDYTIDAYYNKGLIEKEMNVTSE